ncbi:MAG: LD-carboxypeptidase [Armatimonadetes bacterium]|nr:LD-carboxypeptidase [Armatimonadota bacterium]
MGKPKALKPGDTIGLVSPASPLTREKAATGIRLLEEQGYQVKEYPSTYAATGYLAGSDEARAKDLTDAFLDPETQAVYCARGGYGCARLLPYLDFDQLAATEKLFIGFSDITVLHACLNRRGLPTVHGPMAITVGYERQPWVYESLFRALRGDDPIPPEAFTGKCLKPGAATGEVVGGCLILICDLIGTPEQIDMTDKIILLEDVDEAPHRVDAMLTHLLNSGSIQKAAGIVIGEMTRTDERVDKGIGEMPWREIVADRLSGLDMPIIIDFPCGHAPQMLSLPFGIRAEMDAARGTMNYIESLCK